MVQKSESDIFLEDIRKNIEEVGAINIYKSSSISNISSEVLRDAFLAVPKILTNLFNLQFEYAEIPDVWKIPKVTLLRKAGNLKYVNKLRPISLLPLPWI